MAVQPGTRVGSFEILSLLGSGGMGEVYRARDASLGREVALKVLPERIGTDPERRARFTREARALAALSHANIATVHDFAEADGHPYLVLELIEGPTLADRLRTGPLPIDEALDVARQLCAALAAAHDQGIIHRDLKPANIKLRPDGVVKVLDFGLAKVMAPDGDTRIAEHETLSATAAGVILGTAAYMSPEQARGQEVDRRTDVWAFGCVLYEILTGRKAFPGDTLSDTLAKVLERDVDWTALPPSTPPAARALLQRCLEKTPARRWRDLADAGLQLEARALVSADPGPPRGRSALIVAAVFAAAGLLALLASTALYLWRPPGLDPVTRTVDIVTPPTREPYSFAVSPDGRYLAFVADGEGGSHLWIRPLDSAVATPLDETTGASYPFWSPGSDELGFFADGQLKVIRLAGGGTRVLADAPRGRGGTWNRDGVIVFAPSTDGPLLRVPVAGGAPTALYASIKRPLRWPQFLPDGRRFLFVGIGLGVQLGSVEEQVPITVLADPVFSAIQASGYLLTVDQRVLLARSFDAAAGTPSGDARPVVPAPVGSFLPLHSAVSASDTGVLAYRRTVSVRRQLVWTARDGAVVRRVGTPDDSGLAAPALTRDGTRIAVARVVDGFALWVGDARWDTLQRLMTPPRGVRNQPLWSPDGKELVYNMIRASGVSDLMIVNADGAGDERVLFESPVQKNATDWSADGCFVVYAAQAADTGSDLWALPMPASCTARDRLSDRNADPNAPIRLTRSPGDQNEGQFSPDGRWIAYASNETRRFEVYVQAFGSSEGRWQVSHQGGRSPRWSPDGRELYYLTDDGRLMAVPVTTRPGGSFTSGPPAVLFRTRLAIGNNIFNGAFARAQYLVGRDGRFLLNTAVDDPVIEPIRLVLNWESTIKGRTTDSSARTSGIE